MPGKVVDASAFAAIVFGEPDAADALGLVGGDDVYAPYLLAFELANIARTKIVRSPDQRDLILAALELGLGTNINWQDVPPRATVDVALEAGLSAYDAAYLYLARSLNMPLVTFDRRLRKASIGA